MADRLDNATPDYGQVRNWDFERYGLFSPAIKRITHRRCAHIHR
jgi:hypothetical protein